MTTTRHKWNPHPDKTVLAHESSDGNERHDRACLKGCGVTKVTVIPPHAQIFPWLEYRTKDGGEMVWSKAPPCVGGADAAEPAQLREAGAI